MMSGLGPRLIEPTHNLALSLGTVDMGRWLNVTAMAVVLLGWLLLSPLLRLAGSPSWAVQVTVAGAASNLVDRALTGAVRDWLAVGPIVLNVADIAVLAGLVCLGISAIHRREPRRQP